MIFFKDEFEAKACIADMLSEVTYGQVEALGMALEKWDEYDKLKAEYDFTRQYIHDNGLEWDLMSKYSQKQKDVRQLFSEMA